MSAESLRVRSIVGSLGIKLFDIMNNKRDNSDFPITGQQVGMCMTGLRNMGSEWLEVQCMLGALAMTLSSADIELDPVTICTCLYSLRRMGGGRALPQRDSTAATEVNSVSSISSSLMNWNSGDGSIAERRRFRLPAELVDFLDVLESKMSLRTAPLSGSMIATALYGLQGLTADTTAVRRILRHLTTDLLLAYNSSSYQGDMINPVLPLGSQGIANLFFGLQNMSSSHLVVRKMLSAVSVACNASRDFREQGNPIRLTAQAIGNSLYGLQHMSNTHEEVRFALKELTELINIMPSKSNNYLLDFAIEEGSLTDFQKKEYHLASSTYSLSGQNIGNALWGLRNMTISSNPDDPINKELEELLEALSVKISESNYPMNGQNIGNAFYSLQGMSAENPAVRGVLRALAYKLVASNSTMSGLDIGMTLYGLKDMMHEPMIPEVRVIIGFLIYKIRSSDDEQLQFILRDITMSMSGILRAADWIRDDFFNVLSEKSPGFSVAGIVDRVSNCSDST